MRVLVTGFAPFGDEPVNASWAAVAALGRRAARPGVALVCERLPVVFATAPAVLDALVERHRPDAVLSVGEAGGRSVVTPEAMAHNRIEARIRDNAGDQPRGVPVVAAGPPTRGCPLPLDPLVATLRSTGLTADRSDDAGRFVCNQLAYHLYGLDLPALFVHVPALRPVGRSGVGDETDPGEPAPASSHRPLTPDDLTRALEVCVDALVRFSGTDAAGP